jgi:cyclophilin family peptidyl-prolyl cis-trans isomerase
MRNDFGLARRARIALLAACALSVIFVSGCNDEKPYQGKALPYTPEPPLADPEAVIKTSAGDITVTLFEDDAPNTVANFIALAEKPKDPAKPAEGNFYDNLLFHRIVKGFMIQGGDPKGDGSGGPGYKFPDETMGNPNPMDQYALAMANSGPDTNGSQFFIVTAPKGRPDLQHKHTVFGKVTKGQDVVGKLDQSPVVPNKAGEISSPKPEVKILSIRITSKRNHPYEVKDKVLEAPPIPPAPVTPPQTPPPATMPKPEEKKTEEKKAEQKPEEKKAEEKKPETKDEKKPDETKK